MTLDDIREEIADAYADGIPKAEVVRGFKSRLWSIVADWDCLANDLVTPEIAAEGYANDVEISRLIQLAIAEKSDNGDDPEKKIGRLITELALRRADAEFDDILSDIGETVYQDRPRLLGRTSETFAEWGRSFMGERA